MASDPDLFNCRRLPARLTVEQAADLLGFNVPEIVHLMRLKLLPVLGQPARNSRKWLSAHLVEKYAGDEAWLSRATTALGKLTRKKNLLAGASRKPEAMAA